MQCYDCGQLLEDCECDNETTEDFEDNDLPDDTE